MFKTIKSKIILIAVSMFLVLCLTTILLASQLYKSGKEMKVENCGNQVSYYSQAINILILYFQEKARDLASDGEIFHQYNKTTKKYTDYLVEKSFKSKGPSVGGGLWFEPYKSSGKNERHSSYVFLKNGKIVLDNYFGTEAYNYPKKPWYLEIKKELSPTKKVVWVTPYIDSIGTNAYMTTVAVGIYDSKSNLIGMATVDWSLSSILEIISNIRPTDNSFVLFADSGNDYVLALSNDKNATGKSLHSVSWYKENRKNGEEFVYNCKRYVSFIRTLDNRMVLIVNVPINELLYNVNHYLFSLTAFLILSCLFFAAAIYFVLVHNINKPIKKLTEIAKEIGDGNLDTSIKIENPEEFANLAKTFDKMTKDIKDYILKLSTVSAEKKQMEFELKTAKAIQLSALPSIFPPYPEHKEFELHASMDTAKEVGGDFYDFFFIDPNHFAFLIADVSGKGVPAALFMMNAKTLIKNLAKTGLSAEKIITKANKNLCKNNEQDFFVTVFLCIIDLESGSLTCVNAGHNPPLINKKGKGFDYVECDPNLILGAIQDVEYKSCEFRLEADESIFLYTDGVTEAVNPLQELYEEERLLTKLNEYGELPMKKLIDSIKNDIDEFSQGAEQSDDITMLGFKYNGKKEPEQGNVQKIVLPADIKYLDNLISNVEGFCEKTGASDSDKLKLCVASEELFVNIANYAYPPDKDNKSVEITFKALEQQIELRFSDFGTPYNPLEKPDPDVTLSAEERPIGGLGIFMVKNSMDSTEYFYEDGKNVLIIKLKIL